MAPRISAGDLVLYYRLDKQPLAGDIIICNKNGKQYVDRVIAKGGDSVEITEEGTVKVNGSIVLEQNIFYETPQYESEVKYRCNCRKGNVLFWEITGKEQRTAAILERWIHRR